jgi:hypothetical protein
MWGRVFTMLPVVLALGACTFVRVEGAQSAKLTGFGVLRIVPSGQVRMTSYTSEGFGLVPTLRGATLGYSAEKVVIQADPDVCQVVIFKLPEDEKNRKAWEAILASQGGICFAGGEGK